MENKDVTFCKAFAYFLYAASGENDIEAFKNDLKEGVGLMVDFFDSFVHTVADQKCGDEDAAEIYAAKLKEDVFKEYVPQPIEIEIQV
jgi:hypothetical protein